MSQFVNNSYVAEDTDQSRVLDSVYGRHTFDLVPVAALTASGVSVSVATERAINAVILDTEITAAPTGTTPTVIVNFQDSPDGTTWTTRFSTASLNAAGSTRLIALVTSTALFFRASYTIAGTTPSFNMVIRCSPFRVV